MLIYKNNVIIVTTHNIVCTYLYGTKNFSINIITKSSHFFKNSFLSLKIKIALIIHYEFC